MNEIEEYVNSLFEDIPDSARNEDLKLEIILNLSEKAADFIAGGMPKEEAVKRTIEDFGDVSDLRNELADNAREEKLKATGLSLAFSIWGAILTAAFFLFVNLYTSPKYIWFVYPVFAVAWWPLSIFFYRLRIQTGRANGFLYAVCGFTLIAALVIFINVYYSPRVIWCIYPIFAVAWWPLAMLFFSFQKRKSEEDY